VVRVCGRVIAISYDEAATAVTQRVIYLCLGKLAITVTTDAQVRSL
jgi:hypothetical protein